MGVARQRQAELEVIYRSLNNYLYSSGGVPDYTFLSPLHAHFGECFRRLPCRFYRVFCFPSSDVPAHAGFSDFEGLGGGTGEGGGGFRQVGLRCLAQCNISRASNGTGFLPSFREVTLQEKSLL